jgi:hypothetical protein
VLGKYKPLSKGGRGGGTVLANLEILLQLSLSKILLLLLYISINTTKRIRRI